MSTLTSPAAPVPGAGSMSLADLIAAAEQGVIAIPPADLARMKAAAAGPVRHSAGAASAGGVRGKRSASSSGSPAGDLPREGFEVTTQRAKSTGLPYTGVRLHLVLNGRPLRPAYVSGLGVRFILDHSSELRSALDQAESQLSA